MNEVVERVKKAIEEAADEAAEIEGEYCSPAMAEAAARAAIEALRGHPSEAMREACHAYLIGNGPPYDLEDGTELRKDCDGMIRDILSAALRD